RTPRFPYVLSRPRLWRRSSRRGKTLGLGRPFMTDLTLTDDLFFTKTGMDQARVEKLVGDALSGMDDGELFLEYCQSETSPSMTVGSNPPPSIRRKASACAPFP